MRNLPVHWYEGLFLRPQHFQANDRHWAEQLHTSEQWDHPYGYGLHVLKFSEAALANNHFQIDRLQARMPDGTLVDLEAGQEPDRVSLKDAARPPAATADLSEAFDASSTVRLYLGIPKLTLGRKNVGERATDGEIRFHETKLQLQDESWGGNDQEVPLRAFNAKLLLSTQDLTGYDLCPIAQVKRASEGEASPRLDSSYIPPMISISAWPGLSRDIIRALYDVIGQKLDVLSQQVLSRNIGLEAHEPGDADRIMMMSVLNQAYATLGVMAFAQGVHPYPAYLELCRIFGQLSIFGGTRRATEVPAYDHEDLARIFNEIKGRIEALINAVRDYEYEQRFFVGVGLGMQVSLEPKWFNSDWKWYIGVSKGDLSQQECLDLLSPGQLDWKFGSSRQVEFLFTSRAEGLVMKPTDRPDRALPQRRDWLYYEVPRHDSPALRDVHETQTLAMRLRDSLIENRDRLQGDRTILVSAYGRKVPLQFALFAVPQKK